MPPRPRTPAHGRTSDAAPPRRAFRIERADLLRLGSLVMLACAIGSIALVAEMDWDDAEAFGRRDFACFHAAARRAWLGEPGLYADRARLFANPPIALPLVLGLVSLAAHEAWLAIAVGTAVGAVIALALAARIDGTTLRVDRTTAVLVASTAPPLWLAVHLGQLSGLYAAVLAGSLYAWSRGHERTAGAIGALLCLKPPLLLGLALLAIARRAYGFAAGFAATLALLVAASLPFGLERWSEWTVGLGLLADIHEHAPHTWWKQLGLYALVRWALAATPLGPLAARLVWAAIALPIALRVGRELARAPRIDARVASLVALATVALNLYCFVYDGALLAIPALLALRDGDRRSITLAALFWAVTAALPFLGIGVPLAAPVALAWLLVVMRRATETTRADDRSPALVTS